MIRIFIFIICLLAPIICNANEINIKEIDNRLWPQIKIIADFSENKIDINNINLNIKNEGKIIQNKIQKINKIDKTNNIIIAIDTSKSINHEYLNAIKEGMNNYIKNILDNEQISIISFNDYIEVLSGFTSNKEELNNTLKTLKQGGNKTELHAAIKTSCDLLKNIPGTKSLVLISDGIDEGKAVTEIEVLKRLKESNVTVFAIGLPAISKSTVNGSEQLQKLTLQSSGIYEEVETPLELVSVIFNILQSQSRFFPKQYEIFFEIPDLYNTLDHISYFLESNNGKQISFTINRPKSNIEQESNQNLLNSFFNNKFIYITITILIILFILMNMKKNKTKKDNTNDNYVNNKSPYSLEIPEFNSSFQLNYGQSTLGAEKNNTIVIDEPTVSRKHALFIASNSTCQIEDLNSTNGIYVNDQKIDRSVILKPGDKLYFGRVKGFIKYTN